MIPKGKSKRIAVSIPLVLALALNSCNIGVTSHLTESNAEPTNTVTDSMGASTGSGVLTGEGSTVPTTTEGMDSGGTDSTSNWVSTSLHSTTGSSSTDGAGTFSTTNARLPDMGTSGSSSSSTMDTTGDASCEGLSTVQGEVWLVDAADKASLKGVECVDGNLKVSGTVANLSGLESLQIITMDLTFLNDGPLVHADGLSALSVIGGSLEVVIDSELADFSGMENLKSIGNNIRVDSGLKSLDGLQNVSYIGGSVFIGNVNVKTIPSLVSVSALGGVGKLNGHLKIFGAGITSLEGFSQLTDIKGDLLIIGNPLLPTCSAKSLADKALPESVQIEGNLADQCGN